MRFKLSGFIYGMGTGIIVLSLVFYTVYNFNLSEKLTTDKKRSAISNIGVERLEELARGIGMVFPEELRSYAFISIPDSADVYEAVKIFEIVGLVNDASDFADYITEKNVEIHNGDFVIRKDWGYDEILKVISKYK